MSNAPVPHYPELAKDDTEVPLGSVVVDYKFAKDKPAVPLTVHARQVFSPRPDVVFHADIRTVLAQTKEPLPPFDFSLSKKSRVLCWPSNEEQIAVPRTSNLRLDGTTTGYLEWDANRHAIVRPNSAVPMTEAKAHLFGFPLFNGTSDFTVITENGSPVDLGGLTQDEWLVKWRAALLKEQEEWVARQPQEGSDVKTCAEAPEKECLMSLHGGETLIGGGWKILIQATRSEMEEKGELEGPRYPLTHVLRIAREDGSAFENKALEEVLEVLQHCLSFAVGHMVPLGLTVGFDAERNQVYERWGVLYGIPMKKHWAWWDSLHGGRQLKALWPGFWDLWHKSEWQDSSAGINASEKNLLRSVLYWYFEASQADRPTKHMDTGIILSQAALERLAWIELVLCRRVFVEQDFDKLSAAGKIRALLSTLNIPLEIPPEAAASLGTYKRASTKPEEFFDAPHAVTELRNHATHPKAKLKFERGASVDAWRLSLEWIELSVLRLCNYQWTYSPRHQVVWRGAGIPVPWAPKNTSSKIPPGPKG